MVLGLTLFSVLSVVWSSACYKHGYCFTEAAVVSTSTTTKSTRTTPSSTTTVDTKLIAQRTIARNKQLQQKRLNDAKNNQLKSSNVVLKESKVDQSGSDQACMESYIKCADNCFSCVEELQLSFWLNVAPSTPCNVLLNAIETKGLCKPLINGGNDDDTLAFCNVFQSCISIQEANDNDNDDNNSLDVDCSKLTSCYWEGMNEQFLGDGVCHDVINTNGIGCYNSEVCQYDMGDCCDDTCDDSKVTSNYLKCGINGMSCRNPDSADCDSTLTPNKCKDNKDDKTIIEPCEEGTSAYRVMMYDSFGDGWDDSFLVISAGKKEVYNGQLGGGSSATVYVCWSTEPACYDVDLKGGTWGREITWEIKAGYGSGAPSIASGSAPISCQFGVAGMSNDDCPNTCHLAAPKGSDAANGDTYKDLKELRDCIDDKCFIQAAACLADDTCKICFSDDIPLSCFASEAFLALSDCTVCRCSGPDYTEFCAKKIAPSENENFDGDEQVYGMCSANDKMLGGYALKTYTGCTNFTDEDVLLELFDSEHFGGVDSFELCAREYQNSTGTHNGRTALGCLQLLVNAMHPNPETTLNKDSPEYYPRAIAEVARLLYTNAEGFCECSAKAYESVPTCKLFDNFKTLLYESIEACDALDMIDCAALSEFSAVCRPNLISKFQNIDFTKKDQCEYVTDTGCGNSGPLPAFRRYDCDNEVPTEAWDLYVSFDTYCLKGRNDVPALPPTNPRPVAPESATVSPTSAIPVVPGPAPPPKKAYVPPEERTTGGTNKKKSSKFRKFLWFCFFCFVAYHIYLRRHRFSQYQPLFESFSLSGFLSNFSFLNRWNTNNRNYNSGYYNGGGGGGMGFVGGPNDDMYTGLSMESSVSFEPTTLPPAPTSFGGGSSTMGGSGHYAI